MVNMVLTCVVNFVTMTFNSMKASLRVAHP
jgi:hypothetical protein